MSFQSTHLLLWLAIGLFIALAVIVWAGFSRRRTIARLSSVSTEASSALVSSAGPIRILIQVICLVIALITITLALLRPSAGNEITEHQLPSKNIVILLDVSKSMGVIDIEGVSRMEMAKIWLKEFVNNRPYDRIALVTFSGIVLPECPLTRDRSVLNKIIDFQEAGILSVGGTDFEGALKQAGEFLGEQLDVNSSVMILSDGDNVTGDPSEAAKFFKEAGVPIHTISLGDFTQAGIIPDKIAGVEASGVTSQADPSILAGISDSTNGLHVVVTEQSELELSSHMLHESIDAIIIDGENIFNEVFSRPMDIYQYPLTITILMLLIRILLSARTLKWHRLSPGLALISVISICTLGDAKALESDLDSNTEENTLRPFFDYEEAKAAADSENKNLVILFTGSDWSKSSIAFEREIYSHEIFQNWAKKKIILLRVDLPRKSIDKNLRETNRGLATKYTVNAYPTAVFLSINKDSELGRLKYDTKGPASWVERAKDILKGIKEAGSLASSIADLGRADKERLTEKTLNNLERSIRHFELAIKLETEDLPLVIKSEARFDLITELLQRAASLAGDENPKLISPPIQKLGVLNHLKGKALQEDLKGQEDRLQFKQRKELAYDILGFYEEALHNYRLSISYESASEELQGNLVLVLSDINQAKNLIKVYDLHYKAARGTSIALKREKMMHKEMKNWVITSNKVNDSSISDVTEMLNELVGYAQKADYSKLEDFVKASESIVKSPPPHEERSLVKSTEILQETLDYLIPPSQQSRGGGDGDSDPDSPFESEGSGKGSPQDEGDPSKPDDESEPNNQGEEEDSEEGEGGDEEEGEEESDTGGERDFSDSEAKSALKKAEEQTGTLRDHIIKELEKKAKKPRGFQDR